MIFKFPDITPMDAEAVAEWERKQKEDEIEKKCTAWLPAKFCHSNFDSFKVENEAQAQFLKVCKNTTQLIKNGRQVLLCMLGDCGIGKTHLACSMGIDLISDGIKNYHGYEVGMTVKYTTLESVCIACEATKKFSSKENQSDVLDYYTGFDFLIIDEAGRGTVKTENANEILFQLVDKLYQKQHSGCLISNMSFDEFAGYSGRAIMDRLKDIGYFPDLSGLKSYRGQGRMNL